jgi:hypothetical protein
MKKFLFAVISAACLLSCNSETKEATVSEDSTSIKTADGDKKPAAELLDPAMAEGVKSSYLAFSKADIDGMTANYDDNILYAWSAGDSLVGKKAVYDYWKKRWEIIESLNFTNQVVLPIQVNEPQVSTQRPGKYVLIWSLVDAKYKNGKTARFMLHSVNHMNEAGKFDFIRMYYDRHPINEATKDLMK